MKQEGQLQTIKKIFSVAKKNNKFIFIKGGWNIDLSRGGQTREHADIDFHYSIVDKDFWEKFFTKNGFKQEVKSNWYSIFRKGQNIVVDFEGVEISGDAITWSHGGKSGLDEVCEGKKCLGFEYVGMKLDVEKYLKEKHDLRDKDRHDIKLIEKILAK